MKKCDTCDLIEVIDFCNRRFANGKSKKTNILKASLQVITYDRKNRKSGRVGYGDRPVKYCPECGKLIDRNKTIWHM